MILRLLHCFRICLVPKKFEGKCERQKKKKKKKVWERKIEKKNSINYFYMFF